MLDLFVKLANSDCRPSDFTEEFEDAIEEFKTMYHEPINLLDHGFVRLIDNMGSDLSVVRSARVSYDAAWRAGEDTGSDERLINYMMSHQHTTPFESAAVTFEVKAHIIN